jgi:hypothetical protein
MTDSLGLHKAFDGKGDFVTRGISRYYNEQKIYYRVARSRTAGIFSEAGIVGHDDNFSIISNIPATF